MLLLLSLLLLLLVVLVMVVVVLLLLLLLLVLQGFPQSRSLTQSIQITPISATITTVAVSVTTATTAVAAATTTASDTAFNTSAVVAATADRLQKSRVKEIHSIAKVAVGLGHAAATNCTAHRTLTDCAANCAAAGAVKPPTSPSHRQGRDIACTSGTSGTSGTNDTSGIRGTSGIV